MGTIRPACKTLRPGAARYAPPRAKSRKIIAARAQILTKSHRIRYILCQTSETTQELSEPMNAPSELNFEDMLLIRLEVLRREHRDLDEAVHALEATGRPDQLTLRRLKKQKLSLKDQIVKIEDQLIPDIIA